MLFYISILPQSLHSSCQSFISGRTTSNCLTLLLKTGQNIGSVLYVQFVPINQCTINPPCGKTTHNCSTLQKRRHKQVTWHHRMVGRVKKCPDILGVFVCALAAGARQHHKPATPPPPFKQIALFVKCVRLAVACELRPVTDWQPKLTDWSINFISIIPVRVIWLINTDRELSRTAKQCICFI